MGALLEVGFGTGLERMNQNTFNGVYLEDWPRVSLRPASLQGKAAPPSTWLLAAFRLPPVALSPVFETRPSSLGWCTSRRY